MECNQIAQAINLLAGLIPGEDSPKQADGAYLGKLFVFSIMWSIGAILELDDRAKVSEWSATFNVVVRFPVSNYLQVYPAWVLKY